MSHGVLVNMGFTDEKGQPRPCYIMGIRRESGYNSQMYGALFDVMFEDGKTTTSYFHLE